MKIRRSASGTFVGKDMADIERRAYDAFVAVFGPMPFEITDVRASAAHQTPAGEVLVWEADVFAEAR